MVGFALIAAHAESNACSCAAGPSITDRERVARNYENSQLVGVFEVVGSKRSVVIGGKRLKGRFAVLNPGHVFKGVIFSGQTFYASLGGTNTSCEVNFEKGTLILVYANRTEPIEIGFCGISGRLEGALRDIRYLFEITEPQIPRE